MTELDNERAGHLFIELFDGLTKPFKSSVSHASQTALPVKISCDSVAQRLIDEERDEVEYYNRIEKLQEIQENHYLMYVNAISDVDAEKHHAEYLAATDRLNAFIYQ